MDDQSLSIPILEQKRYPKWLDKMACKILRVNQIVFLQDSKQAILSNGSNWVVKVQWILRKHSNLEKINLTWLGQ